MLYAGCDLGSTAAKAVLLDVEDDAARIAAWAIEPSGFSPDETARLVIERACAQAGVETGAVADICCTGYGREHVASIPRNVSEISCHARGAHFLAPDVRTVIDVGGQDVKVIALSKSGKVVDFAMNDKCAAGTGKFFEAMARTLRVDVEQLGQMALLSRNPVAISSTCSVFAESEVVAAINREEDRSDIAGGIHESIARRLTAMVNRVGLQERVALTGGCAQNPGLRGALEAMLGCAFVKLPCNPQINGALGAALYACGRGAGDDPRFAARPGAPEHPLCEGCVK